jgi:transcriptional regulator with XRE-family HTH domain
VRVKDFALKLKLIREDRGLSQKEVARRCPSVGEKTLSSFETGQRVHAIKFAQLEALCAVYGMTVVAFLTFDVESQIAVPAMAAPVDVVALEQPVAFARRREPVDPLRKTRGDDDASSHLGSSLGTSHTVHAR